MSGFQAQARICPVCIDDHSERRDCTPADLKARIANLQADVARFQRANREHIDRIDELEAAVELAEKEAAMSAGNESDLMVTATDAEIRAERADAEVKRLHVVVDQEARARHEAEALVDGMRGAVVASLDVLTDRLRTLATRITTGPGDA